MPESIFEISPPLSFYVFQRISTIINMFNPSLNIVISILINLKHITIVWRDSDLFFSRCFGEGVGVYHNCLTLYRQMGHFNIVYIYLQFELP